jgi:cytochrome c-type biogenesis protein CcmE
LRKRVLLIIAIVLALGLSYAAYSLFIHAGVDSLTVSELKAQAESLNNQPVRVGGRVAPGSIDWDDEAKVIRFILTDDLENLAIVYEGIVPDSFKPGAELIVTGTYRPDDVLEAVSIGREGSLCNSCH